VTLTREWPYASPVLVDASYLSLSACDRGDNGRQLLKSLLDASARNRLPGPDSDFLIFLKVQ
jgi:hypothetical protein